MGFEDIMSCELCHEYKQYLRRIENNGLYVRGFPRHVSEELVVRFFNQFGSVADLYYNEQSQYCLVKYDDRQPFKELLFSQYPVTFYGNVLHFRKMQPSRARIEGKEELDPRVILDSIRQTPDFESQVVHFLKEVEADDNACDKLQQICNDLQNALRRIAPHCKIVPFGSSVNGLAFKGSDVDIFYGPDPHDNSGYVRDLFSKSSAILKKSEFVGTFEPVPNARVPILKFVHKPTGVHCDMSFKYMGVQNSKLIKFLTTLDRRIKPFFMILKYWAKLHNITGKRFSNYALTLLLITFLQSLNDPILPPLYQLLEKQPKYRRHPSTWNAEFCDDPSRLRPVSNNLPLDELLGRFFSSTISTDFKNYVVCPFMGSLIHKQCFESSNRVPREMSDYVRYLNTGGSHIKVATSFSIQDPIELNLNVTQNMSAGDFQFFQKHCTFAAKLNQSTPPHLFLSELLSTSIDFKSKKEEKTWVPNPMHTRPLRPYMTLYVPNPENVSDEIQWRVDLTKKVVQIFKKILKIHVALGDKKGLDIKPGADTELMCTGSQVLWENRDKLWKQLNLHLSSSERGEIEIAELDSDGEVQVLQVSSEEDTQNQSRKRKACDENESSNKRRRTEGQPNQMNESQSDCSVELVDLDCDETVQNHSSVRTVDDEIMLTNEMVQRGHAQPSTKPILDFICRVCKANSGAHIEISDRRSVNHYFSSLCAYLHDFLARHLENTST